MSKNKILFDPINGRAIDTTLIQDKIINFGYNDAVEDIIKESSNLDVKTFVKCTARILTNFGMVRSGTFNGLKRYPDGTVTGDGKLLECWEVVGDDLIKIRNFISASRCSRERLLLELDNNRREELIQQIWMITKRLLPITMGTTSYGLVGASKILFAVLPEIVLPTDNSQWLNVFQTVDLGDITRQMASEIQDWEKVKKVNLNELGPKGMLTTLPSVYNVMAMEARPKKIK